MEAETIAIADKNRETPTKASRVERNDMIAEPD
jgi:hypothetical protein